MSGNMVNMLAAKKMKLHGMTSSKWTTTDKINQYQGLIKLYTRDKKIIRSDAAVNKKKTHRLLKDFTKQIYADRNALDNAIRGDKQQLKNTLFVYKDLQMAYQDSDPKKVVEEINQRNFSRRKILDGLLHEKKKKSQRLIDLNLEKSILEDRLNYKYLSRIKEMKEAKIITGKVQDAILRKDAAIVICRIYTEMLDIMKKDSLYFDAIIETVQNDGYNQSKCFLGATKLGQIATEYLDDRKQEYKSLEKVIVRDMKQRKIDIRNLNEQVKQATFSIKQLLRKDSDVGTCSIKFKETPSMERLYKDLSAMKNTLDFLLNVTSVPSYDSIYPCLEEQIKQNSRLKCLVKKFEQTKDTFQNKVNHAQMISSLLETTMVEDIKTYRSEKQELISTINDLKAKKCDTEKVLAYYRITAAKIRIALHQLLQISYNIQKQDSKKKVAAFFVPTPTLKEQLLNSLDKDEINGKEIVSILISSFTKLMTEYFAIRKKHDLYEAYKQIEVMMQARMDVMPSVDEKISQTSLLFGLYTENPQELTREDIKRQGQAIIAAKKINEDLSPMFDVDDRKYKKPKNIKK